MSAKGPCRAPESTFRFAGAGHHINRLCFKCNKGKPSGGGKLNKLKLWMCRSCVTTKEGI